MEELVIKLFRGAGPKLVVRVVKDHLVGGASLEWAQRVQEALVR